MDNQDPNSLQTPKQTPEISDASPVNNPIPVNPQTQPTNYSPNPSPSGSIPTGVTPSSPIQPAPSMQPKTSTSASVLTIVFLILFYPIGLILVWTITKWSSTVKWVLTGLFIFYIAIMGIMSSMIFVGLGSARGKARDAQVKSNLSQVRTTLEIYYDDHSTPTNEAGSYPLTNSYQTMISNLQSSGTLQSIPTLPSSSYVPRYCSSNGQSYNLEVNLESGDQPNWVLSPQDSPKDDCTPMP